MVSQILFSALNDGVTEKVFAWPTLSGGVRIARDFEEERYFYRPSPFVRQRLPLGSTFLFTASPKTANGAATDYYGGSSQNRPRRGRFGSNWDQN